MVTFGHVAKMAP